ncbi:hypothetical protein [Flavimaricola marinus]|uniref:Uncharacterized protein n=1 Tax=Flavimaricola marinus TaxID=1819565 RepID=A0A238LB08_9RHOB|nr:hypothetical protein [Flavimaricola marinus]SMY06156.1 hypothetical protein LOM8899_00278 [Flavimaricola marinus]
MLADGLVLPALVLALVGWLVPRGLSVMFPEGVRPLMLLSLCSTIVMFVLGCAFFVSIYVLRGVPLAVLFEAGVAAAVVHFGRLGLVSAFIWAPIMILSIAGLPKTWVHETW